MKLPQTISAMRRQAGILLMECLIYLGVFAILLGSGTLAFYHCWDHTRGVIRATDDIAAALRAGEHWRADVRAATGKISLQTTTAGEVLRIPSGQREILYRWEAGEMRREIPAQHLVQPLRLKVKTSEMKAVDNASARVWRWELELAMPPLQAKQLKRPLVFTFAAAQTKP